MSDRPRRALVSISHLPRASAVFIAFQLALAATFAMLVAELVLHFVSGQPFTNQFDGVPLWPDFLAMIGLIFAGLFLSNVVGVAIWRLFAYLRRKAFKRRVA